ncbi:MAG: hypothetical protein ACYDA6_03595, partial [Solirubrobacteraceae bacterium]
AQAFNFPLGYPLERRPAEELGVQAHIATDGAGARQIELSAERVLYGVQIDAPGATRVEDSFTVEPGRTRRILLLPAGGEDGAGEAANGEPVFLGALNLLGRVPVEAG